MTLDARRLVGGFMYVHTYLCGYDMTDEDESWRDRLEVWSEILVEPWLHLLPSTTTNRARFLLVGLRQRANKERKLALWF